MTNRLDRLLAGLGTALPGLLLGIVLVVVTANVVARSILGMSFHAAHDIALIAFAGTVWFGLVGAAAAGQMIGVTYFRGLLPARWQPLARLVAHLCVIAIALAVIHAAHAQITTARFSRFLALGWPKWIVSAGLLGAMALMILVELRAIATAIGTLRRGGAAATPGADSADGPR
jgi:TRAP-type C4-dicarboxylate transport system permease small subunit